MVRIRVQRPRSASDVTGSLQPVAVITLVALKLTGIITWSWWWVLAPLWIGGAALALLAGVFVILWCLGSWPMILVNPSYWRLRKQTRLFLSLPPPVLPPTSRNEAETTDTGQRQGDGETGPRQDPGS